MDSQLTGATPLSLNAVPSPFDARGLADIKRAAKTDDPKALKAAAQQFESLFLQMVLKSMREATPQDGMFDSEQSKFYESLLDQQLAQSLTSKGGGTGLAAMIERQLTRTSSQAQELDGPVLLHPPAVPVPLSRSAAVPLVAADRPLMLPAPTLPAATANSSRPSSVASDFVAQMMPLAIDAARATGVPAHFMVAQSALETGWGRAMPRAADGHSSNNLFGIKAGHDWTGPVVETSTLEYVNGLPERQTQRFRAYGSYAESFADYAKLLVNNPRYASVLAGSTGNAGNAGVSARSFARGLQSAGYATDPAYAVKLEQIIASVASS